MSKHSSDGSSENKHLVEQRGLVKVTRFAPASSLSDGNTYAAYTAGEGPFENNFMTDVGRPKSVNLKVNLQIFCIDGLLSVHLSLAQHVSIQNPWSE